MAGAKLIVLPNIALAFENKFALIICYQGFNEADSHPGMPACQGTFVETKHPLKLKFSISNFQFLMNF